MKKLFVELFESYYKDIYTYLYNLCHDASLSEDLTAEVFLEVVKSIASFRGNSDIKTWLFSIPLSKRIAMPVKYRHCYSFSILNSIFEN